MGKISIFENLIKHQNKNPDSLNKPPNKSRPLKINACPEYKGQPQREQKIPPPPSPYLPRSAPLGPGRPFIPARPVSPAPSMDRLAQSGIDRTHGPGAQVVPTFMSVPGPLPIVLIYLYDSPPGPETLEHTHFSPFLYYVLQWGKSPLILHTFSRPFSPQNAGTKKAP